MRELKFRAWFEDEMIFSDCATGEFDFVFDSDGNMEFNVWNDEKHKLTPDGDVGFWKFENDYTSREINPFNKEMLERIKKIEDAVVK